MVKYEGVSFSEADRANILDHFGKIIALGLGSEWEFGHSIDENMEEEYATLFDDYGDTVVMIVRSRESYGYFDRKESLKSQGQSLSLVLDNVLN